MNKTPLNDLIDEELKRTNNPSAVARRLGMNYQQMMVRNKRLNEASSIKEEVMPEPDDISALGRSGMERFVVAIRRTTNGEWPKKYKEDLDKARQRYDAGTHEMAQGRKNGWFVLYSIPRQHQTKPRNYFRSL
jgi:hypothetical protein